MLWRESQEKTGAPPEETSEDEILTKNRNSKKGCSDVADEILTKNGLVL